MRVFTLDVGSGTQDFMLAEFDLESVKTESETESESKSSFCKNIRNSLKMILPSPTRIVASKIRRSKNVFLYGYTMGGGACKKAAFEHAKKYRVLASEKAALTFSDNLERVKKAGIEICSSTGIEKELKDKKEFTAIEMKDVDWEFFMRTFDSLSVDYPEVSIVAVQDHGYSKEKSNRKFRFELFEKKLKKGASLSDFVYESENVPEVYNRMASVAESYEDFGKKFGKLYIVDTVFAAMAGCLREVKRPALVMNFGNSHFVGAVVGEDGQILSMFEHHTKVIEKKVREKGIEWVADFIGRFLRGEIDFDDVYNDGGHGAYVRDVVDVRDIISTGPRVELSPFKVAGSCGEVMITGNIGMLNLLSLYLRR